MPFCGYCGSQEPADATYCGSCGERLLTTPSTAPILPQQSSQIGKQLTAPPGQQKAEPHGHFQQKRKHWRWHAQSRAIWQNSRARDRVIKLILAVALVVAVVAGALTYVHHLVSNSPLQITEFPLPSANSFADAITAGPDGNLWFTEEKSNRIGRITPTGKINEFPLPTTKSFPDAITSGPDGNLWFVETENDGDAPQPRGQIGRITPTGKITEFPLPADSYTPVMIAAGPDGNLWFTEEWNYSIGQVTPGGRITVFPSDLGLITGITTGPDGDLWFTVLGNNPIGRISPGGQITEFPLPGFTSPNHILGAITVGPDGNLWFIEHTIASDGEFIDSKIGRITPGKQMASTAFQLPTTNCTTDCVPEAIIAGPDGNLWFTENIFLSRGVPNGSEIGRITPGGSVTFPVPNFQNYDLISLSDITVGPDGNLWFMGQTSDHGIILRMTL